MKVTMRGGMNTKAVLLGVGMLLAGGMNANAERIVVGDAASLAIDQPRVNIAILDVPEGVEPDLQEHLVGPSTYNTALLDTGANGILLGSLAYIGIESNPNYEQAINPTTGEKVYYYETGVGEVAEKMDVYKEYTLAYTGWNDVQTQVIENVNIFGNSKTNLGSFSAIVGMPAMIGRHTKIDVTPLRSNGLDEIPYIESQIRDTAFGAGPKPFDIDLRLVEIPYSKKKPNGSFYHEDDAMPTYAPLPVIDHVVTRKDGEDSSNTLLLDTGAQTNIISNAMAASLDLNLDPNDPENDIVEWLDVGGIGGQVQMPLCVLDELALPTAGGDEIVWTQVMVGVLDIMNAPFDGVFGMNMLASGYTFEGILNETNTPATGIFDGFELDFSQDESLVGRMTLEMNPNYVLPVPEPATAMLIGAVMFVGLGRRRCR